MTNYQVSREWWVERWLELLSSYRFKKRLERSRIYAREGNVLRIEFKGAQVLAKVQGSGREPYQVSLSLEPFSDEDWEYVVETMSNKAVFSAQLLAGEMPHNIEEVFTANGVSLFPFTLQEINSRCTCPDGANPCKHIGAVYYQLAERFREEPFVLFQLRGRTKAQILEQLRQLRHSGMEEQDKKAALVEDNTPNSGLESSSKTLEFERFWRYEESMSSSLVEIVPPQDGKTVLNVLGNIPLAAADARVVRQYLEAVYQTASQQAMIAALNRE